MRRFISWLLSLFMVSSSAAGSYGAWVPEWDAAAALPEAASLTRQLDTVVAFAAYFREDGSIWLPMATEELLQQLQEKYAGKNACVYLSVVNDVVAADGSSQQKSRELLEQLLSDDAAMEAHIDELLELVDTCGLAGLEIDYENIKNNADLWQRYALFLERLSARLTPMNVKLRADLEWGARKYISLPEGITYSIMCYNLYGYHSGPGPKADLLFLQEAADLYAGDADKVSMAFSAGGFLWKDGSVQRALTQQQAAELAKTAKVSCTRDSGSGALHARWESDGSSFELWYADGQTLNTWKQAMQSAGFTHFDLFRLGGNDLPDLIGSYFS